MFTNHMRTAALIVDYGMRQSDMFKMDAMAEDLKLHRRYCETAMAAVRKKGWFGAKPGNRGGYWITPKGMGVTMYDIIEALILERDRPYLAFFDRFRSLSPGKFLEIHRRVGERKALDVGQLSDGDLAAIRAAKVSPDAPTFDDEH